MTPFQLLSFISANSVWLPTLLALFTINSLKKKSLKIFFIFLVTTSLKETVCTYYAINSLNNYPIYNSLSIAYYGLLFLSFKSYFENRKIKRLITILLLVFSLFYMLNLLFIQGLIKFNSYTFLLGGLFLNFICLVFFYNLLNSTRNVKIIKLPFFWFSTGLVFYSTGTIILLGLFEFYRNLPPSTGAQLWSINSILNISVNLLISIGLYWNRNTEISS